MTPPWRRRAQAQRRRRGRRRRVLAGRRALDRPGKLYAGSSELQRGIAALRKGNADLAGGIAQLSAGGGQLTGGLQRWRDGAAALEAGLGQLTNGAVSSRAASRAEPGPPGQLAGGLGHAAGRRRQVPRPRCPRQGPRAAPAPVAGPVRLRLLRARRRRRARPPRTGQLASFAVNLERGGTAGQIVSCRAARREPDATRPRRGPPGLGRPFATATAHAGRRRRAGGRPRGLHRRDQGAACRSSSSPRAGHRARADGRAAHVLCRSSPSRSTCSRRLATFGVLTVLFTGATRSWAAPGTSTRCPIIGIFSAIFGLSIVYEVFLLAGPASTCSRAKPARRGPPSGCGTPPPQRPEPPRSWSPPTLPFAFSTC